MLSWPIFITSLYTLSKVRNSFLVNIVLLVFINVLVKPAYIFAVEIPVQNLVGNDAYGLYFAILNLAYIFQLVSDLGLQNFTYTELPTNRGLVSKYVSNISVARLGLGLLFFAIVTLVGFMLGYVQRDPWLFGMITVNVLLISSLQYIRSNISGLGLYFFDSLLSSADKFLMLVLIIFFFYMGDKTAFSIHTFVEIQMASLFVVILVGVLILGRRMRFTRVSWDAIRRYVRQAIPHGILIGLMFLYTRVDALMIESMLTDGDREAGLYASAYRLYDAANMLTFLFVTLLLPMFSEAKSDRNRANMLYYSSMNMIIGLAIIVSVPLIFYRSSVMHALYVDVTEGSELSLAILLAAFIWKSVLFVSSALLTSAKRFLALGLVFSISILINVGVNYVCIPKLGIIGASWATLASQVFVAICCVALIHRYDLVIGRLRGYLTAMAILPIAAFIGYFMTQFSRFDMIPGLLLQFALLGLLYLSLNYRLVAQLSRNAQRQ